MIERESVLPDGYRPTEPGPLPEEWRVVRLREVVKVTKGRKPSVLLRKPSEGSLPYLTADYFRSNTASLFVPRELCRVLPTCTKQDVVLIWDGSKAGQVFTGLEGVLASTMVRIDPTSAMIDKSFLHVYLLTQFHTFNSQTTGTTIPHVSRQVFANLRIPLPPLPEQRAIAQVLRAVQEAKEATKRVVAAARELKKSLMRHLFTYGPVPVDAADRAPVQETKIGRLPAHWRVERLGDVFDIQQGKALCRRRDKGLRLRPFLRTANVLWGNIDLSNLDKMDFTEEEEKRYKLEPNDLLVCEGGDVGRAAIWDGQLERVYYQNHLHRLRRKMDSVEPRFVMYWMHAAIKLRGLYVGEGNRTTIPNLSRSRLAGFPIPLPPLSEQREIARILQTVDCKVAVEEQRKTALEALFKTLLHDLMTAKRRLPAELVARFGRELEETS